MMRAHQQREPYWVHAILDWQWTLLTARLALTSAYVLGGLTKVFDFPAAVAEMMRFGLSPGWLWATLSILVELGCSALGGVGVLTAVAMLVANNFWAAPAGSQLHVANDFFEHVGLIAGFVLVALIADRSSETGQGKISSTPVLQQGSAKNVRPKPLLHRADLLGIRSA
jgi:uncharacterized membrane protein YphA (DoxX/SURF4 family)